ncbi:MAG TPA: arsenite methyltransferase [Blastocatellia bacterium]|nr:arsenite methyltransferase [Blastocatellia bacterium]
MNRESQKEVRDVVASKYGAIAGSGLSGDHAGVRDVAEAFGYSVEELRSIPAGANMGLSCGNPTASANLRKGEVVVDLGCGGGLDVFLAAEKVGPSGRAIGIDMTPEMIDRARRNAATGLEGRPYENVDFHLSTIDRLPLPDDSVDCVISNCVINLAPDKQAVFREISRVLKPGGRVAISDIALKKPLPPDISNDLLAFVGCVAGAMLVEDYRNSLVHAGLANVEIVDTRADLLAYAKLENEHAAGTLPVAGCCSPTKSAFSDLLKKYNINDYAASVKIFAMKPREQ